LIYYDYCKKYFPILIVHVFLINVMKIPVLERSGEWDTLGQSGHWTVFAPTEEAFERLPGDMLNRLLEGDACVDSE
jgi:uncharacterized surface protein with fasciclin (FAS1) repeats